MSWKLVAIIGVLLLATATATAKTTSYTYIIHEDKLYKIAITSIEVTNNTITIQGKIIEVRDVSKKTVVFENGKLARELPSWLLTISRVELYKYGIAGIPITIGCLLVTIAVLRARKRKVVVEGFPSEID